MIETKPVRQIPGWLSGLVIFGSAVGIGWFVWTSWLGAGPRERIVIMEKGPNDKITTSLGVSEIHWGDVKVVVRKADAPEGGYDFSYIDIQKREMPAEDRNVLQAMADFEKQAFLRTSIGLSPTQFGAVKEIRKGAAEQLPAEDSARFKTMWAVYEAAKGDEAKRKDAEKKLLKAVNDLELRMKPLVLKSAAERAAKARSILTTEQWRKFEEVKKPEEGK